MAKCRIFHTWGTWIDNGFIYCYSGPPYNEDNLVKRGVWEEISCLRCGKKTKGRTRLNEQ